MGPFFFLLERGIYGKTQVRSLVFIQLEDCFQGTCLTRELLEQGLSFVLCLCQVVLVSKQGFWLH